MIYEEIGMAAALPFSKTSFSSKVEPDWISTSLRLYDKSNYGQFSL